MVPIYFAPMEGITEAVFRRVHHECFPGVEAYYMPFISPTMHLVLTSREKRNVLPEYNPGVPCVPQVVTKTPEHFLWAARCLADMGWQEINLNAGCPSGTVTAKGKGAGMLRDPLDMEDFLDHVCAKSPLPVSVKTRVGFDSPEAWPELLKIYAAYPLKRLIVHPRTCRDRYDPGTVRMDCWQAAREGYPGELVYNGNLFTPEDAQALLRNSPRTSGIMLGRGLVANPALARELNGGPGPSREEIVRFHDRLLEGYLAFYRPDITFMKLRVVMKHLTCCFETTPRLERDIRKSRNLEELLEKDRQVFETCEMRERPYFRDDPED